LVVIVNHPYEGGIPHIPKTLQLQAKSRRTTPQRVLFPVVNNLNPLMPKRLISSLPPLVRRTSGRPKIIHLNMTPTPSMTTSQRMSLLTKRLIGGTATSKRLESFARLLAFVALIALSTAAANADCPKECCAQGEGEGEPIQ